MAKTILTERQKRLLNLLSQESYIQQNFCLSGGTALSEYYLQHRLSEDLDFFSLEEVNHTAILIILKKIKSQVNFQKVTFENSFNRNLFFLHFSDEIIKTEFTYYPFEQIEQPQKKNDLKIDSLIDIAVNKVNVIFSTPRTRDFVDLYLILQKEKRTFESLTKKWRIKFDMYVDPLQMTQLLLTVRDVKDYPRMLIPFDFKICEAFWLNEAQKLEKDILK